MSKKQSEKETIIKEQKYIGVNKLPENSAKQNITSKEAASVEDFIVKAIEQNVSIETMEKLFALRKEVKTEQAKEAFIVAMSRFQAECPIIAKNKNVLNKDGKTVRYSYASLDSIISQVKSLLGKCGFSYTTSVLNEPGFITAVCRATHTLGHSEESGFRIPIDTEGYMTAPQQYASALTFAKRYAFCNVFGILTGEDDFDASNVGKKSEMLTLSSTKGKIMFLLKELGIDTNVEKDVIKKTVKDLTQLEIKDDVAVLDEIKSRLEVLVHERRDENA